MIMNEVEVATVHNSPQRNEIDRQTSNMYNKIPNLEKKKYFTVFLWRVLHQIHDDTVSYYSTLKWQF